MSANDERAREMLAEMRSLMRSAEEWRAANTHEPEPFDAERFAEHVRRCTCTMLPTLPVVVEHGWEDARMQLAAGEVKLSPSAYREVLALRGSAEYEGEVGG